VLTIIERKNSENPLNGQTKTQVKTTTKSAQQIKRALVIVFDGIEEVEALAPVDILRRAGVEVVMAGVSQQSTVEGRNGIRFQADQALNEIDPSAFDLLFLPGGPGVVPLAENKSVIRLLQNFDLQSKWVTAICAAPKVLAQAGILDDRPATGHSSVRAELPIPSDDRIVQSDHILTSQGAGTAVEFGLRLAAVLTDEETAQAVAESIHAIQ